MEQIKRDIYLSRLIERRENDEGIDMVNRIHAISGAGHSCSIHSKNEEHIRRTIRLSTTIIPHGFTAPCRLQRLRIERRFLQALSGMRSCLEIIRILSWIKRNFLQPFYQMAQHKKDGFIM